MHLAEVLRHRPIPAAAVFVAITRRCPLRCRHCSTNSLSTSEQVDGELFERFVATFSVTDRPDLLLLTGGEPLLRPGLVGRLARSARAAGTATYALTGMYAARSNRFTQKVYRAITALDHLAISIDTFHEEQVPRQQTFAAAHRVLDGGTDVSFQVVGLGPDDPYLADITDAVRREFADRVPVLVGGVGAVGRARSLPATELPEHRSATNAGAVSPCVIAAWPTVGYDGTVTACANQDVVDHRPLPEHLRLGHIDTDDWPTIRRRCVESPTLRALRTLGPLGITARADLPGGGYCETCWRLPDPLPIPPVSAALERAVVAANERAGPAAFVRRHGIGRYADLVHLGDPPAAAGPCPG